MGSTKLKFAANLLRYISIGGSIATLALPPGVAHIAGLVTRMAAEIGEDLSEVSEASQVELDEQRSIIIADGLRIADEIKQAREQMLADPRP